MRDALEGLVQLCSPFFSDKRIYFLFFLTLSASY